MTLWRCVLRLLWRSFIDEKRPDLKGEKYAIKIEDFSEKIEVWG